MTKWPADNQAALLAFYGTPGPDVERQLVNVTPPFKMYYDGQPVRAIRFHRKAADALAAALAEIWEHYGRDQTKIDALGISKYAGAYNPRKVRGSATKWSNHAFGAAIDLNAAENGLNAGHGNMPQPVIDAFKRQGARWGGDYHGRTDPMHFEFCDASGYPGVGLMSSDDSNLEVDSDTDTPQDTSQDAPVSTSSGRGFFGRMRNWVVTGASSLGFTGLGFLTDWQVAVAFFVFLFLMLASSIGFIIWFFGADAVRTWVKEQVL